MAKKKILLKDKMILVLYVGCKEMETYKTNMTMTEAFNKFSSFADESTKIIVLPDSSMLDRQFRLECINPKYITEEDQNRLTVSLDKFINIINQYD